MSENTPSVTGLSMEGEEFANDYHWRSTKAKQQLRDRFGRWISQGANVKFQDNGSEQSGIVTSVVDGKAYVDMKNLDGTVTKKILDPISLRVIASKATLPPDGSKIQDPGNNFYKKINSPEYRKAMADTGQAVITRADGYALSASTLENKAQGNDNKTIDPSATDPQNNSKGNPVLYQLFAPGGRSLGTYSQGAEKDFDSMVDDDKAAQQPSGADASGPADQAPEASPNPVAASGDILVTGDNSKTYRVPESVKSIIAFSLQNDEALNPQDRVAAEALAFQEHVTIDEVRWIGQYFDTVSPLEQLRGGYEGRKWATKILAPSAPPLPETEDMCHPKYMFDDDTFAYFAIGTDEGSSLVVGLISVDYETGAVYSWTEDGFSLIPDLDMTDVDEPQIIPIDEMTADEFAHWLDSGADGNFDVLDVFPEERNLFTLADSEIDYAELDDAFSIIAAGEGYTPQERSQNAKAQGRAAGGRFGSGGVGSKKPAPAPTSAAPSTVTPTNGGDPAKAPTDQQSNSTPDDSAPKEKKATLPVALPLVADPAARISEWISTASEAPMVAAGDPAPTDDSSAPADGNPPADQAIEDSNTGPTDEALYFAIVDDVDKTAVLDIVAIVKTNGQPSAFVRKDGTWQSDPDTLSQLQGSTPPPVVELTDPATVKSVLQQIDDHDSGKDSSPDDGQAQQAAPAPVAASGYALPDGTYTIIDVEDLQEAVVASGESPELFVKAHIRKRARALNRMDVVPEEWREFTLAEIGEISAAQCVYGEFGEIIVASGIPKVADTPSDMRNVMKLKNYWTHGKGALKIRWGTPGDLTRAHRHLAKYVGPDRAWGLAQNYHKFLFGVSNTTHDVATGQYRHHHRKK